MTTIAWDGETLAGDRMGVWGGTPYQVETKVFRLDDGGVVGFAGSEALALATVRWLNEGRKDRPPCSNDDVIALWAKPTGEVVCLSDGLLESPLPRPKWAIGAGADYALAAMFCGRTSVGAVEIAAEFSTTTGLGVTFMSLKL